MDPMLAEMLAILAPFLIAMMTKAQATNRFRTIISLLMVAALTVATVVGDAYPNEFQAIAAQAGRLIAIIVATYKVVDTLLPSGLNGSLFPDKGLSDK